MSRRVTVILISLVSILTVLSVYFGFYGRESSDINVRTSAASGSATLTSQAEWEAGTLDNIDSTSSPGNLEKDEKTGGEIDLYSIYNENPSRLTTSHENYASRILNCPINTNCNWPTPTSWEGGRDSEWWLLDLGNTYTIDAAKYNTTSNTIWYEPGIPGNYCDSGCPFYEENFIQLSSSTNGIDYSLIKNISSGIFSDDWDTFSPFLSQYVKISSNSLGYDASNKYFYGIERLRLRQPSTISTHTSASTQLDAGDHDSVEWTTFVPDDTIPANTSINYRFRTSADAATWGSWTASTASAASIDISTLLGGTDNAKRYLQVESTLANTDGASTPTISAYTANYDYEDLPEETCFDGIQNQDETGIDCGGTICDACPTCSDGIQNGDETGVDCGGSCDACVPDPTCSDGIQNQGEEDIDCGGPCDACVPGPTCSDGIQNQGEEGIDCGGPCPPCAGPTPAGPTETYIAEIVPPTFTLGPGETQLLSTVFKDKNGNIVPKETVGLLSPDFGGYSSFFSVASAGGILTDENKDNLTVLFTAGATGGTYTNTVVFSANRGAYKSYSTPAVTAPISINVSVSEEIVLEPGESFTFEAEATDNYNRDVTDSTSFSWSLPEGGGTLNTTSGKAVKFTAGESEGIFTLSTSGNHQGATASGSTRVHIIKLTADNEFYFYSDPSGTDNRTWVGEPTKFQLVIRVLSSDGTWPVRWGEDVKAEITEAGVAKITAGPTVNSHIFTIMPEKEGCYPFLIRGWWERFGKLYETYIGFNIAGNDPESAYYQYQPYLGGSLFANQNMYPDSNVRMSLTRRDKSGRAFSWYNWIYVNHNLRTTWYLNDTRLGTLVPHYNTAYLKPLSALPGYYPNAITTKVTFRGETQIENWDIQVYSKSEYDAKLKTKLSDKIPAKVTVRPGSLFNVIPNSLEVVGLKFPQSASGDFQFDFDQSVLQRINSNSSGEYASSPSIFRASGKAGYYKNAITVTNLSDSATEPRTKTIDLEIDPNCSIDLCTSGIGIGGGDDEIDDGILEPKKGIIGRIKDILDSILDYLKSIGLSNVATAIGILAALIALIALLLQAIANLLTMIRPGELWAYLIKGRDKKRAKGLVYDASSGLGVPLAKILLIRSRDQKLIRIATSGSDGKFALETPPGEEYFIQVKKEGYDALYGTQARISGMSLAYETNYFGEDFRADDTHLLFEKTIPLTTNGESIKLAFSARIFETVSKVLRALNIPLLIFGFMMSTIAVIQSRTPYNLVIFCLYLLIFAYYLIKIFFIDGRSFGLVINQANMRGVDLSVVRAISETKGKLAKTTITDYKGRYSLSLTKGFYKIIAAKPGLEQASPLSVRVKSNFKPRTEKIVMIETRTETNSNTEVRNLKPVPNPNTLRPAPYTPSVTPGAQPPTSSPSLPSSASLASNPTRSFSDSGEIVEKYAEKSSRFGTNNLSDIGLHHLIMSKKMEEEISETNKEINSIGRNKKESDSDHPNWQLPNSSSPL